MTPLRSLGALVLLSSLATTAIAAEPPADKSGNRVITTEAVHALVLPMKGSYGQHPAAFERLAGYLAARGAAPAGAPFARYFSDPSVGEAGLSWEVGFPVAAGVTAEAPFEIRDVPATLAAVHVHRGSYEELAGAWPAFIEWILASGYQPAGAPVQVFNGDPSTPEVELRMPVQK